MLNYVSFRSNVPTISNDFLYSPSGNLRNEIFHDIYEIKHIHWRDFIWDSLLKIDVGQIFPSCINKNSSEKYAFAVCSEHCIKWNAELSVLLFFNSSFNKKQIIRIFVRVECLMLDPEWISLRMPLIFPGRLEHSVQSIFRQIRISKSKRHEKSNHEKTTEGMEICLVQLSVRLFFFWVL